MRPELFDQSFNEFCSSDWYLQSLGSPMRMHGLQSKALTPPLNYDALERPPQFKLSGSRRQFERCNNGVAILPDAEPGDHFRESCHSLNPQSAKCRLHANPGQQKISKVRSQPQLEQAPHSSQLAFRGAKRKYCKSCSELSVDPFSS